MKCIICLTKDAVKEERCWDCYKKFEARTKKLLVKKLQESETRMKKNGFDFFAQYYAKEREKLEQTKPIEGVEQW